MLKAKFLKAGLWLSTIMRSKSYMKIYNKYLGAYGTDLGGVIKYIHPSAYIDVAYAPKLHIGDNCVISINCVVLAHDFSIECGMNSIGLGDLNNEKK